MLGVANSPKLREIFRAEFSVLALKSGEKVKHTLPQSPEQWKHVISKVLDFRNRECGPHEASFELNRPKVEADAKKLHHRRYSPPVLGVQTQVEWEGGCFLVLSLSWLGEERLEVLCRSQLLTPSLHSL